MTPFVIDLSHNNEFPGDYAALVAIFKQMKADGIVGIIHKASQGVSVTDKLYKLRRNAAAEADLLWGAYHWLSPTSTPAGQARHFLDVAALNPGDLAALDYEDDGGITLAMARDWLVAIEAALGRKAIIYGGALLRSHMTTAASYIAGHRLWYSQYNKVADKVPPVWKTYWLWQYSESEEHGGIPVDVSTYQGLPSELMAEWSGAAVAQLAASADVKAEVTPPAVVPVILFPSVLPAAPKPTLWQRILAFFGFA